jgi:hypothetical protein
VLLFTGSTAVVIVVLMLGSIVAAGRKKYK